MKPLAAGLFSCLLLSSVLLSASAASAQRATPDSPVSSTGRLDVLIEAGIERYRAGAYREAIAVLSSAVAARADAPAPQLYLALSHLRGEDDALARRHLVALRGLAINPRLRAQVDYVLEGMQAGPLSPPLRQFIAAAFDETMALERAPRRPAFVDTLLRRNFPYFP